MTINDFLSAYGNRNKIGIVYYPKDETEQTQTIVSSIVVEMYLKNHYRSWEMFTDSAEESLSQFQTYNRIMGGNLKRALDTFEMEYNPIENYNGSETTINEFGIDVTFDTTGSQLNEFNYGETKSTATDGVTTNDSSVFNDTTKVNTETEARKDTTNVGERIDEHRREKHTDTTTIEKHGNLGVTSTQNMALQEAELRQKNLIFEYLDKMAHDLWMYVGGC